MLQATCLASELSPVGRVHVLDMGEPVRILDLARRFVQANGMRLIEGGGSMPGVSSGEIGLVETGARPGEKLAEILAHPGETLRPTAHSAIQTWDGVVPSLGIVDRLLDMVAPGRSTSAEVVVEGLRRAIATVDGGTFGDRSKSSFATAALLAADRG